MLSTTLADQLTTTTENLVKVLLPVIMKHLVGLIDDHVPKAAKSEHLRPVDEVQQTARGRDKDVTSLAELVDLVAEGATAVDNTGSEHATVAKLAGLHEDLDGKLASGYHDANQWLGTHRRAGSTRRRIGTGSSKLLGFAHQLVQDGNEIGSSLSGTLERISRCI